MCVEYTNLNKAWPEDCYPLLRIDSLVDSTVGYQYLSFLDAFWGYHQIKMDLQDQTHTSFRTASAIYCYS